MVEGDESFLVLGVGFGKTIVALTAIVDLCEREGRTLRTLVVSTKKIIELTWGQEIADWEHTKHLTYAAGTGRLLKKAVAARPDVLGINFESLERFYDMVDAGDALLPDILVIDESSRMKAPNANRVKRHCGFGLSSVPRGYVHRFKYRIALSATPTAEGYAGIWSQECAVSRKRRIGINITSFRNEYCTARWNGTTMIYEVGELAKARIHDALKDLLVTSQSDKYMDLADPIYSKVVLPWEPSELERYRQLEEDSILQAEQLDGQTSIFAPNVGVLFNKLRQLASGFLYEEVGEERKTHVFPSAVDKLQALDLIRESSDDVPLVVFVQYKAEMEMLSRWFPDAQIGLPPTLEAWNAKKIPMLVLHPRSAGHGINLQHGSHIAVWFALPWSYEEWHQANGRLHRTGQTRQVSVIRLEREHSIELNVWAALQGKGKTLQSFIDQIRSRCDAAMQEGE